MKQLSHRVSTLLHFRFKTLQVLKKYQHLSHTKYIRTCKGKGWGLAFLKSSQLVEMSSRVAKRLGFGVILSRFKSKVLYLVMHFILLCWVLVAAHRLQHAQAQQLPSAQAQLLCYMWDFSRSGTEPVSLAPQRGLNLWNSRESRNPSSFIYQLCNFEQVASYLGASVSKCNY